MRLADDGEIQFRGPTLFKGYWDDPEATAAAITADGWYRTGDIGRLDEAGRLILMGRTKDIIVLPNGLNVYPEDIENALRVAGIRDSVVVETRPGRIEAVVLPPAGAADGRRRDRRPRRARPATPPIKAANARLAPHQRDPGVRGLARGRLPAHPHAQGQARRRPPWAALDEPLPVREEPNDAAPPQRGGVNPCRRSRAPPRSWASPDPATSTGAHV